MNQCSRVELSRIVKVKIILVKVKVIIIDRIMQRCKVGTVRDNGLATHTRLAN